MSNHDTVNTLEALYGNNPEELNLYRSITQHDGCLWRSARHYTEQEWFSLEDE